MKISLDDVRALYQLRLIIEPPAAGLAAGASLPKDFFITCSKLMERMRQIANENTSAERSYERFSQFGKAEYGFPCEIARASGNRRLAKTSSELMNKFRRFHYVTCQRSPWLELSTEEHIDILETLRCHDAPAARSLMYEHIREGSQRAFQLVLNSRSGQARKSAGTLTSLRATTGPASGVE
jgi:DNA-binding GntR family transcriptional regulator